MGGYLIGLPCNGNGTTSLTLSTEDLALGHVAAQGGALRARPSKSFPAGKIHALVRKIRAPRHRRSRALPNGSDSDLPWKWGERFRYPSAPLFPALLLAPGH